MGWNRRDFLLRAGLSLGLGRSLLEAVPSAWATEEEPRFTPPPGEETPEIKALIDAAKAELESGRKHPTDLLVSSDSMAAHPWPRFRSLIRQFSRDPQVTIVTPGEPGEPLRVTGAVLGSDGKALAGATLYAYQTSSKGWYSDKAPHVSGMAGDEKHARLFGYLKTGSDGRFELRSIRPAGYPNSDLPQHIHVEVFHPTTSQALITEVRFDDDPRLTPAHRERSKQEGFQIRVPRREANGLWQLESEFRLR